MEYNSNINAYSSRQTAYIMVMPYYAMIGLIQNYAGPIILYDCLRVTDSVRTLSPLFLHRGLPYT